MAEGEREKRLIQAGSRERGRERERERGTNRQRGTAVNSEKTILDLTRKFHLIEFWIAFSTDVASLRAPMLFCID